MVNVDYFFSSLKHAGVEFFSGVPDSLLKDICAYITDNTSPDNHIIAANEGNAISIGIGHHLATKKIHTSVHFKPLYKFGPLKQNREYPVCEAEWIKLITLPCHNRMLEEDIDYVVYWVNLYFQEYA